MQLSLRKNKNGSSVGLDIDGGFLAAAEVSNGVVSRVASMDMTPGVSRDGEIADPGALSEELKDFFRRESLPSTVRLGVANQQIVVRQIEIPSIEDADDRDAAVRFQAADAVPMPLEDAILDYQLVERVTVDGSSRDRVVVVAARESMIHQLLDAVRAGGLKVEGIDLNAFALVRTLAGGAGIPHDVAPSQMARVFCHLGGVTNLAIAAGSTCMFTRPLSTDWDSETAEVGEIASSLADQIRLSIDFHLNLPGGRRVEDVLLSGPGAQREGLVEQLDELVIPPVSLAKPLGELSAYTLAPDENPNRYTVAAGLALGASL